MQDYGLVSIITPSYNTAGFIAETIRSVQSQTYPNWEMIIVDDCSSDNTDEVVKPFLADDKRIKYLKNERNSGAAISRNKALRMAQGKWVAFLDSDDLWLPEKLERQLKFMVENGYHFSYHGYEEIDEMSQTIGVYVGGKRKVSKWEMYACCWPGCLAVMYDASFIGLIQISDIKKNNDTAMWIWVVQKSSCYFLNDNLARYRRRKGSITPSSTWVKIKWHYTLFHDAVGLKPMLALFWTVVNIAGNASKKIWYIKHITK